LVLLYFHVVIGLSLKFSNQRSFYFNFFREIGGIFFLRHFLMLLQLYYQNIVARALMVLCYCIAHSKTLSW
jgi:hypothetical protein